MVKAFETNNNDDILLWVDQISNAFITDIQTDATANFISVLDGILQQLAQRNGNLGQLHYVLTAMQQYGFVYFQTKKVAQTAANLWHQARILIAEKQVQIEAYRTLRVSEQVCALERLNQVVNTTFNLSELVETLYQHLPRLGIEHGYLSLYNSQESPSRLSKLILAFTAGKRISIPPEGILFPPCNLAPGEMMPGTPFFLGLYPLFFRKEHLGLFLFDLASIERFFRDSFTCESLIGTISSAVKRALLVEKLKIKEGLLEERTYQLVLVNKELEQLAYTISNGLQEPLRMVIGYSQLIEQRYKGKLDSDADEFIEYAKSGAIRMQNLINDLVEFARVGNQRKPFESVDLNKIVEQALLNLKIVIMEQQALVTRAEMPVIWGDPGQMVQLFQNLVGNAVKFHGPKPPVVHLDVERKGNEWQFSVNDNGIGLDMNHAGRIFKIFQRLHTKDEYPGTGIGLSICKKIVEHHGGRIWVESTPGAGATFYFTIPASIDNYN